MKYAIAIALMLFSVALAAQPAAPPVPAATTPVVCDVTYSADVNTMDGHDVSFSQITLNAVPWADVQDNHRKQMRVLDQLSKEQDKGGVYQIEVSEYQACDGGAAVKIADGSALLQGVTLAGTNRVARVALAQADLITQRYEQRANRGDKQGWDHGRAKKVQRDDLGRRKWSQN